MGSGPYCYSNSFAMLLGAQAPSTAVIEVATGGPFGMQLIGGTLVFFDAYGWDPEQGFDRALAAIGWTSTVSKGGDADSALARLAAAVRQGPVWVGPVEMGHLRHQPEMTGPIGADHFVVALDVDDERVLVHDPHGYPYAEVPVGDFMTAWRAETVSYGDAYTMRTGFAKVAEVSDADAIRSIIPAALDWLSMRTEAEMPPGSLGNGAAAERVAGLVEAGAGDGLREHLMYFAIRVGAPAQRHRRLPAAGRLRRGVPDRRGAGQAGRLAAVPDGHQGFPGGSRRAAQARSDVRPAARGARLARVEPRAGGSRGECLHLF
ncbi:hypothetical protein ACFQZ4_07300 [Catellatospora coxensis]